MLKKTRIALIVACFATLISNAYGDHRIVIMRHGEGIHNVKQMFCSEESEKFRCPLTDRGKNQAAESGKKLKALGLRFTHAFVSPLVRTRETAQIVLGELGLLEGTKNFKMSIEPLVIENRMGSMNGKTVDDLKSQYGVQPSDLGHAQEYGGESEADVEARLEKFAQKLKTIQNDVLIVTHGFPARKLIRLLKCHEKLNCSEKSVELNPAGYEVIQVHQES